MFTRERNWSNWPIDESETVFQGSSFQENCICISLKWYIIQQQVIPFSKAMMINIVNILHHFVWHHTIFRNWSYKSWYQITVSTRIRKPPQKHKQTQTLLYPTTNTNSIPPQTLLCWYLIISGIWKASASVNKSCLAKRHSAVHSVGSKSSKSKRPYFS